MLVREVMSEVISLSFKAQAREAVNVFLERKQDLVPMVDTQGKLLAVITKYDLYRGILEGVKLDDPIAQLPWREPIKILVNETFNALEEILVRLQVAHAVVVDHNEHPVGLVAKVDLIRTLIGRSRLQQTLAAVLEAAYDGIFAVDGHGQITLVSQAMSDYLGLSTEDMLGHPIGLVFPEARMEETLLTGAGDRGHLLSIEGQQCILSRIPLLDGDQVIGAVGVLMFRGLEHLRDIVHRLDTLEKQVSYYKSELSRFTEHQLHVDDIVTCNRTMESLKTKAGRAAASLSTILILGETGTGKDVLVQAIHNDSGRNGPLIKVNCAAIPDSLLESEFFGYEDGAFTGAKKGGKPGKFELADGGTIFLDEIGDMSPYLQAKLLRVLQERAFERVGGTRTIKVNVRVIAATNQNLEELITEGKFRADLFYRLNVIRLRLPPLRDRKEDLRPLAYSFIEKFNRILGRNVSGLSPDALYLLQKYNWPGNIRELENAIEHALNLTSQGVIQPSNLPEYLRLDNSLVIGPPAPTKLSGIRHMGKQADREAILVALKEADGNRSRAARLLGISRSTLYEKMARLGV